MISLVVSVGMWLERFVIIVSSLQHAEQPSMRANVLSDHLGLEHVPGTIGLFTFAMFLFMRVLPAISISEMKAMVPPPPESPSDTKARPPAEPEAVPR